MSDADGATMNAASARVDVLALGEAMVEFNQAGADDPATYLQGFGGDTSNWRSPPRASARAPAT